MLVLRKGAKEGEKRGGGGMDRVALLPNSRRDYRRGVDQSGDDACARARWPSPGTQLVRGAAWLNE